MKKRSVGDLKVVFEPGATQRADLGTKPFTRERLKQLLDLWNMVDRREVETASMRTAQVQGSWLKKLVMFLPSVQYYRPEGADQGRSTMGPLHRDLGVGCDRDSVVGNGKRVLEGQRCEIEGFEGKSWIWKNNTGRAKRASAVYSHWSQLILRMIRPVGCYT